MLSELCAKLHNYFCADEDKHFDVFTISGGTITPLDFLLDGQYFRIIGSTFNDGVYKYDDELELTDETFDGAIWAMKVPVTVVDLADDIKEWQDKNAEQLSSPFNSESFGGYSYTKKSSGSNRAYSWEDEFASRLSPWRKI